MTQPTTAETLGADTNTVAKAALRKASLRLIPLIALGYGAAYMDRINISFASLQMNRDLHFSATVYGLAPRWPRPASSPESSSTSCTGSLPNKQMAACFVIVGVTSVCKQLVQHWYRYTLRFNEVHAFNRQSEIRVIRPGDVLLFRQIPSREVKIIAWEPHSLFDFGKGHFRAIGIHTSTVIEDRKYRETAVQITLHLIHEINRARHRILNPRLTRRSLRIVFRSSIRIRENFVSRRYLGELLEIPCSHNVRMIPSRHIPVDTMNRLLSSLRANL
jgi:hypothetical protein